MCVATRILHTPARVRKVFGINRRIHCRRELRFPTGRDSEIAPTGFLYIFCQLLYTPPFRIPILTT